MTGLAEAWDPDQHIDAVAPLLGLAVTEAQRPGVRRFLAVAKTMAETVEAACPPDALDLAPVFVPVVPEAADDETDAGR
jgi:hypothetical protein